MHLKFIQIIETQGWFGPSPLHPRLDITVTTKPQIYMEPSEDEVREWILNTALTPRIIPLKLFLDMVTSSFADVSRSLRECFREIDVEE